ncbi:hypothetical protein G7Y89_g10920 [Cudoniella acicularis]|uniref:Uncharacterized protein n=1 Tax=Cudoniella acicularis TaxID=354080 RepID=A0A8H4VYJ2_9HELO|nr:hypothetical protein G7Y89_g10920 [Cudoniella acicularis]
MSFPYKTVLVVGATSGIGLALAEKFISNGSHVVACGRRQENLDELVRKHGKDKVSPIQFDITDLKGIPNFVGQVIRAHPTLDSILLNSGIQRKFDFTQPESIDLDLLGTELTTNYLSYVHLFTAFLPFLQKQSHPTCLMFTTSGLALIPITRCPNYCATKAAMHHMILALREQLSETNVKVIEILPPAVQTELHDEKHQPDIKDGRNMGIPLDEFTEEAWRGLLEGKTDIPIGMAKNSYEGFELKRQKQ